MNDWFEWNGVRCTEYGMYVTEQPPPTIPAERATFINIPGKSGSLTTVEGDYVYDDLLLTAICVIRDPARIPDLAGWLRGNGTVTFANRQGGFYHARIVNQIPFEKILRGNPHRLFSVNFRCKPFFHMSAVPPITLTSSGTFITNPGNVPSEPIITVTGTGEISLMVGMSIVELTEMNGSITLDSTIMEAYNGVTSMNAHMSGEFPIFLPGRNAVSWTGNVTKVEILPNWSCL